MGCASFFNTRRQKKGEQTPQEQSRSFSLGADVSILDIDPISSLKKKKDVFSYKGRLIIYVALSCSQQVRGPMWD